MPASTAAPVRMVCLVTRCLYAGAHKRLGIRAAAWARELSRMGVCRSANEVGRCVGANACSGFISADACGRCVGTDACSGFISADACCRFVGADACGRFIEADACGGFIEADACGRFIEADACGGFIGVDDAGRWHRIVLPGWA